MASTLGTPGVGPGGASGIPGPTRPHRAINRIADVDMPVQVVNVSMVTSYSN